MRDIVCLHLSDIHARDESGGAPSTNDVFESLLADVTAQTASLTPDLIVISGDLAYSGKHEEYAVAATRTSQLLARLAAHGEQLFMVPGNHDVDRESITFLARGGKDFLLDEDSVDRVLASEADRELLFARFRNYEEFARLGFGFRRKAEELGYPVTARVKIGSASVGVVGLSSSWLSSSGDEKGHLVVGRRQVDTGLAVVRGDDVRIVILHHPLDWLAGFDLVYVEKALAAGCDVVLHGHVHNAIPAVVTSGRGISTRAVVVGGGAAYTTDVHPMAYNIVRINPDNKRIAIETRVYQAKLQKWQSQQPNRRPVQVRHAASSDGKTRALFEDVAAGRCLPFVGAGFSEGAANQIIPTYRELADMLRDFLPNADDTRALAPEKVFEAAVNEYGSQWVRDKICEILGNAAPGAVHKLFTRFSWPYIVTTNYDRLLERACRENSQDPIVCLSEAGLAQTSGLHDPSRVDTVIVKIHGDCTQRGSMVIDPSLGERDPQRRYPALSEFLRTELTEKSALFLGYSTFDPNTAFLRRLIGSALRHSRVSSRNDYVVLIDPSEAELRYWREEKGVVAVILEAEGRNLTRNGCMHEFLSDMERHPKRVRGRRQTSVSGSILRPAAEGRERAVEKYGDLEQEVNALSESRTPFCGLVSSDYLMEPWLRFMQNIDTTQSIVCLGVAYESISALGQPGARDLVSVLNRGGNVFSLVLDFTDGPAEAKALHAAAWRELIAAIPVTQSAQAVPLGFLPIGPILYDVEALLRLDRALGVQIEPYLRSLLFSKTIQNLTGILDEGRYDLVVIEAYRAFEGCIRYLTHRIGVLTGTPQPDMKKVFEMVDYLHEHERRFGLTIDEKSIGPFSRLRNGVAHNESVHATQEEAGWCLQVVGDFVRYNIGPNLRTFDVSSGAAWKEEKDAKT